jgi:hypothetical protein
VDIDGDTSVAHELASGENIVFDESVNISYTCTFDQEIPTKGFLRGTAQAGIFNRIDPQTGLPRIFTYSQEWELGGRRDYNQT